MKILPLIIAVVAGIIIPLVVWGLNQSKPDIRFTLSDPIRIGQGGEGKIWQQMEVRNNGNIEAKDIQVKINAQVASYEISKNSEADKPEIFPSPDAFELRYFALPPGGLFAITLGSTKSRINIRDISILHSNGQGVEAFSKKSLVSAILAPIGFVLAMLFYLVLSGYFLSNEWLGNSAECYPEIFLKKRKPWYSNEKKWVRLRKKALGNVFGWSEKHDETTITKSYRILCEDRPLYLSEDEWNELRKDAEERVKDNITAKIQVSYDPIKLLLVFKLKRPVHMLESTWLALQDEANERFLTLKQRELVSASLEKFPSLLNEQIPEGINPSIWEKHLQSVEKKYVAEIVNELRISENQLEFLRQQNLSRISAENVSFLQDIVYKHTIGKIPDVREPDGADKFLKETKPEWMKEKDYIKYTKMAQRTLDFERQRKEYEEESAATAKEQVALSKKIKQVTSQLEIINQVLNDPTAIERVEEYNNPFAPGNFKNLKKIGEFLKKSNETSRK